MRLHAGSSGYSYREWKGPFYPEDLPAGDMLGYYAERLSTVEINNTFYRSPKSEVMARWATVVPDGFVFVIKASQRITHRARLKNADEAVGYLWKAISHLGPHLGPVLFQLPPNFKVDLARLTEFTAALPRDCRAVFEFRHESWDAPEVHEALRASSCALCHADTEDGDEAEVHLVPTADWGYLRLRRPDYSEDDLRRWVDRIRAQPWQEVFVFFKHEDQGAAPRMATRFAELFAKA